MRILLVLFSLILITAVHSSAYYVTYYDTVMVRWPDSTLKEWSMRADYTGVYPGFLKHGRYQTWYQNGQLKEEGEYEWNEKVGVWIKWAEGGQRIEENVYKSGALHGRSIKWNLNNSEAEVLYFKDGKLHGICARYNHYKEDPEHPGLNMREQKFYLNGFMLVDFTEYAKWGPFCELDREYYNDSLDIWIETNKKCKRLKVGRKKGELKHGKWTVYSPDGQIIDVLLYRNDTLIVVE